GYFTDSSYILIIFPFIFGVLKIIYDSIRQKYNFFLIAVLFIFILIFLYWYKLPFAAVKGRYLVPVIPFYILVSLYGAREFFRMLSYYLTDRKIVNSLCLTFITFILIFTAASWYNHKNDYADQTHHISIRNLTAAK